LTISGVGFSEGAMVLIGGASAPQVTVVNSTTITAIAPAHDPGSAVVVVAVNGQSASLAGAVRFVMNAPPVIASIVVRGVKPNEPAQFADIDEPVSVSATVTDAETAVADLAFTWSSDVGTFSGTGPTVTWIAPHSYATPGDVTLTLAVVERLQGTGSAASIETGENRVTRTTTVRVHNSVKEVGDLASDFLSGFSRQLDPAYVTRNFTSSCSGAAAERADVAGNQQDVRITYYKLGAPTTVVGFTGRCPFRNAPGDACSQVPAEWHSLIKAAIYKPEYRPYIGKTQVVTGVDQVTAVLENDQWKLCDSAWNGLTSTIAGLLFRR